MCSYKLCVSMLIAMIISAVNSILITLFYYGLIYKNTGMIIASMIFMGFMFLGVSLVWLCYSHRQHEEAQPLI